MATEPDPPVPQLAETPCWPPQPVRSVDWLVQVSTGGGTVYVRPAD